MNGASQWAFLIARPLVGGLAPGQLVPILQRSLPDEGATPCRPFNSDTLQELRDILGPARLSELLDLFGDELDRRPSALRSALADRDFAAATAEAHSLKGAAANLGATAVKDAARQIETAIASAARGDSRLLAAALRQLSATVDATGKALAEMRDGGLRHALGA